MLQQKRSELLRLLFIVAMLALTVGVVFVYSAKVDGSAQTTAPKFVKGSNDTTFNFSISVAANSNSVRRVDVNRPSAFTVVNCPVNIPAGWTCTKDNPDLLRFQDPTGDVVIAAGNSLSFSVNATASGTSGNVSWSVDTYETTGGVNLNSSKFNVTIDADAPLILTSGLNVSSTNGTLDINNLTAAGNQWIKLSNLVFNVTITDAFDNKVNASVYVNVSNLSHIQAAPTLMPHPDNAGSYSNVVTLTSENPATNRYNGTLASSAFSNGTIVYFVIVANDSVQNRNISNHTTNGMVLTAYNFTVDGAAPLLYTPEMDDIFDASIVDNITTSSATHNFTITATDGESGVSRVELAVNVSGTLTYAAMTHAGSSTTWNYTGTLQSLGVPSGDGNYTVWFKAYDNVTNINESFVSMNVLVDDPSYTITLLATNITNNYTTSNATPINFRIAVSGVTINNTGGNFTINGPNGFKWNMSFVSSTTRWGAVGTVNESVYTVTWNSSATTIPSVINGTFSNLSDLGCWVQGIGNTQDDGDACTIQVTWNDIFGRQNSTNFTITVDNVAPTVLNISNNATSGSVQVVRSGTVMNFTVNANNNILNVTIHNGTIGGYTSNTSFLTSLGSGNYTISKTPDYFCPVDGRCTINFTTVDLSLQIGTNSTGLAHATSFIVDNGAPLVSNFLVNGTSNGTEMVIGSASVRLYSTSSALNITFNVSDQITNVTQVNIGNATLRNATIFTDGSDGYNNITTLAQMGCPANVEGVSCIIRVEAYDNATIDGSKNSNTSVNLTFQIDDLAPRVVNFSTNLAVSHVVTSVDAQINFSVNISDANLPAFNVTVANLTSKKLNKSAVSTSNTSTVTWYVQASVSELGCSLGPAGVCTVFVVANDSAGNVNSTVSISVTVNNATFRIDNLTGSIGTRGVLASSKPTITVNTSALAQCRYPSGGALAYSNMENQFNVQNSRHNSFTIASDLRDNDYDYRVACVNVDGNNETADTARFSVDTTSLWNVTIGATGSLSVAKDYFTQAGRFYTFRLPKTNILDTTAVNARYNVTDVLASVMGSSPGTAATNNVSIIYAYNRTGNSWTSFVFGRTTNTFTNFTSDVMDYYINFTVANERIEIG